MHLRDRIEESVGALTVLLVMRGVDDRLTTTGWARGLATAAPTGTYLDLPGAHTFACAHPEAWSEPVCRLARDAASSPE